MQNHNAVKVKLILPSLAESKSPLWRPIKYSLFPPLGLATLAAYLDPDDDVEIIDQHVEKVKLNDSPDLVIIQVYITNSKRAYRIADHYRAIGSYVILGGIHVTSLPEEAVIHADTIFIGPAEQTFPKFINDFRNNIPKRKYTSTEGRTLHSLPPIRRDLIKRQAYLVPNSIVISRGCPYHCNFCYKDAFFKGGKSFYTQQIDDILAEIERLPGKHLYFLDDHLFANPKFATELFKAMEGMGRVFQGAATVNSILKGDTLKAASRAGLRSLFVGFETISEKNLQLSNKKQNLNQDYEKAIQRLHHHGIMINGSFVFGMDGDDTDIFEQTVEWGVKNALTTSTYHIMTPYPGTGLYRQMQQEKRMLHQDWELYDTRHAVYRPAKMSIEELEYGYKKAYQSFYSWQNILRASLNHDSVKHNLKHFFYTAGWKKFEGLWKVIVNTGTLAYMLPMLELLLSEVNNNGASTIQVTAKSFKKLALSRRLAS